MKISVACFTGNSGLTDYSISLCKALAKDNISIKFYTGALCDDRFNLYGFEIIRIFRRSRHYFLDIFKFIYQILLDRPNYIIFQNCLKFPMLEILIVLTFRIFNIKTIIEIHDLLPHYPEFYSKIEYKLFYKSFNKIITHSEKVKNSLFLMGISGKILVIPHGIYDIFNLGNVTRLESRKSFGFLESDLVILFFGFIEPRKGAIEFIEAAKQSCEHGYSFKFLMAGDCDLNRFGYEFNENILAAMQLPNVIFHGSRIQFDNVERYFKAADIIALPYHEGTTSGVLKIAIAFSKPVVATKVGDISEELPGGGILIESSQLTGNELLKGFMEIRDNYKSYKSGIENYDKSIEWKNISANLVDFLKD